MEFTICEPILHNSASQSFMNQTPFKIYRADFELKNGVLLAEYYYNKVNRKYKFHEGRHPGYLPTKPPVLSKFLDECKTDCGVLKIEFNKWIYGCGLWVITKLFENNISLITQVNGNQISYSPSVNLDFIDGKLYFNHRKMRALIKQLKVSVYIINHTTVIGSGRIEVDTPYGVPKKIRRYSKCKKVLKNLLMTVGGDPKRLSPIIEKALIGGYRKVSEDSEALQKTYKASYSEGEWTQ